MKKLVVLLTFLVSLNAQASGDSITCDQEMVDMAKIVFQQNFEISDFDSDPQSDVSYWGSERQSVEGGYLHIDLQSHDIGVTYELKSEKLPSGCLVTYFKEIPDVN